MPSKQMKVTKPEIWAEMQKPENSFLVELAKAFGSVRIKIGEREWVK